MPLTQLDPTPALVLIDLQKGIMQMAGAHAAHEILSRSAQLVNAFRERGLPVVLVHVTGMPAGRTDAAVPNFSSFPPDWADLMPELGHQPTDLVITKQCWGAFTGTSLDADLRQRGVTQIILAGVATSIGVESTARSAFESGYNVVLVSDAMTDRDPDAHRHSLEKIFPRLGQVDTTATVLQLLEKLGTDRR